MFNKEDKIKWNDLSRSLQDIIMRRMTWKMLHPSLQKWLLHLEARVTELERNLFYMWYGQQGQVAKVDIAGKYLYPSDNLLINGVSISDDEKTKTSTGDVNLDIYRLDEDLVYPASGDPSHDIDDHEYRTLMYNPVLEHLYWYTEKDIYIKLFPYLDVLRLILYKLWADGKQGQVVKVDKTDNTLYPHNNFIDSKDIVDDYDSGTSAYSSSSAYNVGTTANHKVVTDELDKDQPDVKTTERILMYNPEYEHLFWCLTNQKYEKLFPYLDVLRDEILIALWDGKEGQVTKVHPDTSISYTYSKVHKKGVLFPHNNFIDSKDVVDDYDTDTQDHSGSYNVKTTSSHKSVTDELDSGVSTVDRVLMYNPKYEHLFWCLTNQKYEKLFPYLDVLRDEILSALWEGEKGQVAKVDPDKNSTYGTANTSVVHSKGILYPHDNFIVTSEINSDNYTEKLSQSLEKSLSAASITDTNTISNSTQGTNRVLIYNPETEELFWFQKPGKYTQILGAASELTESVQNWPNGLMGQVLKLNPGAELEKIYPHDEMKICYVIDKDEYLDPDYLNETFKSEVITTTENFTNKDIFDGWERYTHYNIAAISDIDNSDHSSETTEGQNVAGDTAHSAYLRGNAWRYDKDTKCIYNNLNNEVVAGFYKQGTSDNYEIELYVDSMWDDDNFHIVLGFMTDNNGVEHTLSVVRAAGFAGMMDIDTTDVFVDPNTNRLKDVRQWLYNQ